jgi:hypothetical protein
MIQEQQLDVRYRPQKRSTFTGLLVWGSTVLSMDLPLVTVIDITERERRTNYTQLDQQDKA